MITFVDTSAIISLIRSNHQFNERSSQVLGEALSEGGLVINGVVYSELSADDYFDSPEKVDEFLNDTRINLKTPGKKAMFLAGKKFKEYLDNRGQNLQCPSCGYETRFECPECGQEIFPRQHLPSDFLIGAHAEVHADRLITFDRGFFEAYFDVETVGIRD